MEERKFSREVIGLTEVKRDLFDLIEQHKDDLVDFLSKLIELKPLNLGTRGSGQEFAAQNWLNSKLTEMGFDKVDYWAADPEGKRPNVVATLRALVEATRSSTMGT